MRFEQIEDALETYAPALSRTEVAKHAWSAGKRLVEYLNYSLGYKLVGYCCDHPDELELWLFCDADLASDVESTKSSSGVWLGLYGPSTMMPLAWLCQRQTATAKSNQPSIQQLFG